jgi:hypothetical protein
MPASPRPFADGQHAIHSRQAARVPRLTGAAERRRAPCGALQNIGRCLLCPRTLSLSADSTRTGCREASPPRAGQECYPDPPQRRPPFRAGQETQRVSPPRQGPRHLRGAPASAAQASARPGRGEVPADGGSAARGISVAQGKGDGLCQRDRAFRTAQPPLPGGIRHRTALPACPRRRCLPAHALRCGNRRVRANLRFLSAGCDLKLSRCR